MKGMTPVVTILSGDAVETKQVERWQAAKALRLEKKLPHYFESISGIRCVG